MKHSVYDIDTPFTINPITREISTTEKKVSLVKGDHNSECFRFTLPLEVEGHDLSKCDRIEIHFNNIDAQTKVQSKGVYLVTDLQNYEEDSTKAVFSWLISGQATKYVGLLSFTIRFSCLDGTNLTYAWSTAICSCITIVDSINNGEPVIAEYTDILEAWKREIDANTITKIVQTEVGNPDGGTNTWSMFFGDGRKYTFSMKNGDNGDSAYEIAKRYGYEGSEEEWLESLQGKDGSAVEKGDPGDSAYEVAVKNGFEGTEEEWLASLKGEKGEQGIQGIQGEKGEKGDGADIDTSNLANGIKRSASGFTISIDDLSPTTKKLKILVTEYREHEDSDYDHVCDHCGAVIECTDTNGDHFCEYCGMPLGSHLDLDGNHTCDYGCAEIIGAHEDKDGDGFCDYCGAQMGVHADNNGDGLCDYCGAPIGSGSRTVTIKTALASDPSTIVETVLARVAAYAYLSPILDYYGTPKPMIITTDREDIELSCTYVRDTNKAVKELREAIGEGGGDSVDLSNYYNKQEIDAMFGDIDTALDSIIEIQEGLIGGASE